MNAVREDPVRRDLLYAGTERQVWVSFDGGDRWQSLRVNMPATSVRDLVVKGDDLVAGTHGRGFWILDDVTPLRQLGPAVLARPAHLFAPQVALRFRANKNTDTPLPPDEPGAPNPPEGAVLHYHLAAAASRVVLEVVDESGRLVRRYASDDPVEPPVGGRNIPDYWIRPPQRLSAAPGLHRFVWDLREPAPQAASFSYPIAAVAGDTPREPRGPWVLPGSYTVRLTVDGEAVAERPLSGAHGPEGEGAASRPRGAARVVDAPLRRDAPCGRGARLAHGRHRRGGGRGRERGRSAGAPAPPPRAAARDGRGDGRAPDAGGRVGGRRDDPRARRDDHGTEPLMARRAILLTLLCPAVAAAQLPSPSTGLDVVIGHREVVRSAILGAVAAERGGRGELRAAA